MGEWFLTPLTTEEKFERVQAPADARQKRVLIVEEGRIFGSVVQAAKWLAVDAQRVYSIINDHPGKTVRGRHFVYASPTQKLTDIVPRYPLDELFLINLIEKAGCRVTVRGSDFVAKGIQQEEFMAAMINRAVAKKASLTIKRYRDGLTFGWTSAT